MSFETPRWGERLTEVSVAPDFESDVWTPVKTRVDDGGELGVSVGDATAVGTLSLDWSERSVTLQLTASGWGGGNPVPAAYDDVVFERA